MQNHDFFRRKFGLELNDYALVYLQDHSLESLLEVYYKSEVERNGRPYLTDDYTTQMRVLVAGWIMGKRSSCMLYGGVGLGKTMMLKAVIRLFEYLRSPVNIPPLRCRPTVYVDATQWAQKVAGNLESQYEAYNCRILFLDDAGQECECYNYWGNRISPIKDLLLHRYDRRLATVIATNLSLKEWAERYGNRVADRMNELYDFIEYPPHDSYRRM